MPGPHDFAVRISAVRLARSIESLTSFARPAISSHPTLPRPPHPTSRFVTIGRNAPLHRGGMAESMVVICPTAQGERRAALWYDGQIAHGWHARIARRAHISSEADWRPPQQRKVRPDGRDPPADAAKWRVTASPSTRTTPADFVSIGERPSFVGKTPR
jgi:hypothetical protein